MRTQIIYRDVLSPWLVGDNCGMCGAIFTDVVKEWVTHWKDNHPTKFVSKKAEIQHIYEVKYKPRVLGRVI